MFRFDNDPSLFDSMNIEENLNNNIGFNQIKDIEIYSDSWIPAPSEFFSELPDLLLEGEIMEFKEQTTRTPSPAPAISSTPIEEVYEVKSEDLGFDLINYMIYGEVRLKQTKKLEKNIKLNFFLS